MIWYAVAFILGGLVGVLIAAVMASGARMDGWMEGYEAGARDAKANNTSIVENNAAAKGEM